jgi:carboxymethylenebutenolidase
MIQSETAVIATEGSRQFEGHFARPQTGRGPGLLIFSEMWGVAEKKRELADDYARRGWCALAANMFWRSEFTGVVPFDQADKAWQRLQAFDFDQSAEDARTAAAWLRRQPQCDGRIAAVGFCMGGRIAFLAAARAGIDAAIGLYALGIAKHLDEVRDMAVPLQLH